MVDIVAYLHQYVPHLERTEEHAVPNSTDVEVVFDASMHQIMFGGDQLTKVRATAAIKIKANAESPTSRLEGIMHQDTVRGKH